MKPKRPLIGVGIIIIKNNKILLIKRKNSHGSGTWAFAGGHLEFNEALEECAKREAKEEVGVELKNIKSVAFTNDFFPKEKKHYITLFVQANIKKGTPKNMEPEKSSEIKWFEWDKFPKPLFVPVANLRKQNYNPFEDDS